MMNVNIQQSQRLGAYIQPVPVSKSMSHKHICRSQKNDEGKINGTSTIDRRLAMLSMVSGLSLVGGEFSPVLAQGTILFHSH